MNQLQIDNVYYRPPGSDKLLLDNVNLGINQKGVTAIVGPNGAGKSLLLRLAYGLIMPSFGSVAWSEKTEMKQSMVFQRPVLLRRSAAANLVYPLALGGVPREQRQKRVAALSDRMAFSTKLLQQDARALSVGQQQKLAIGRAWITEPDIVFMDEPTASLDPNATADIEQAVLQMRNAGIGVVISSHDMHQVKRLADSVIFVHQGRCLLQQSCIQFFSQPQHTKAADFIQGELLL